MKIIKAVLLEESDMIPKAGGNKINSAKAKVYRHCLSAGIVIFRGSLIKNAYGKIDSK